MCFLVNKCCFCISLEVGTKVISVLSLLCWVATAVVYAAASAVVSTPAAAHSKQWFYVFAAAIALFQTFSSSLLVYGAFWSKPRYLWPWLVTSWMSGGSLMLLSLLGAVLLAVQYYNDVETLTDISTMSSFYFVCAAVVYYCVTVVESRRVQMIRAEETESADSLVRHTYIPKSLVV